MRKPLRVLAYARVSSREQGRDGTSLDAQRERLDRWCAERGYPAPAVVYTEVESGGEEKREKRDELIRLLGEAQRGDAVVTICVDRWTRDVVAGVADVRGLLAKGVDWYAIDDGIDASTDAGKDALEARAAGAAAERRRIKSRTVGARNRLRDQGLWVEGPEPFGYRRGDRAARRQCHLSIVSPEAALIREAFERCVRGSSIVDILEWWNVERGADHDRIVVWRLLRNRVYCGEIESSTGAWIKGQHEAIITRDLFERAQEALTSRRKGGRKPSGESRTATWLLRGLGSCPDCGARMGAAYSSGGALGYYACNTRTRHGTCSSGYAPVERIDTIAGELALARLVELRAQLAQLTSPTGETPRPPDFAAHRARLAAELARAETLAVRGTLSEAGLARQRERLDGELGRVLVAEAAAERVAQASNPLARRRALVRVGQIEATWAHVEVAARRLALGLLVRRIVVHAYEVQIEWKTAEDLCTAAADANLFGAPDDAPPVAPRRRP